jgi:hypothetical protein
MYRVLRPGGTIIAVEPVEESTLFSSSDDAFCHKATDFVNTYQEMAALAGMDFNLGLRLPSLLAQTGWRSILAEGFLHVLHSSPHQGQPPQSESSEQLLVWKRKLQQVVKLAGKPSDATDLPIFDLSFPGDLLTTFTLIIGTGRK